MVGDSRTHRGVGQLGGPLRCAGNIVSGPDCGEEQDYEADDERRSAEDEDHRRGHVIVRTLAREQHAPQKQEGAATRKKHDENRDDDKEDADSGKRCELAWGRRRREWRGPRLA